MDREILIVVITIVGSGVAAWLGAWLQFRKWNEGEREKVQNEGEKAGAEATESYAKAAGSMADLASGATTQLQEMMTRYANLNDRLAVVEKDNREKGNQIAALLSEKESAAKAKAEQDRKIYDQENRIVDLAQSVGTWQFNHRQLQLELEDVRAWAEKLVGQVLELGGTPVKLTRKQQPGVVM